MAPVAALLLAPWLLVQLPSMGTVRWDCASDRPGYRVYGLSLDVRAATATETVAFWAGGRRLLVRRVAGEVVRFPRVDAAVQRIVVRQATEPGVLRASVTVDFSPRPVSPSHCFAHLPPRVSVTVLPR